VFKLGPQGLGYYVDPTQAAAVAAAGPTPKFMGASDEVVVDMLAAAPTPAAATRSVASTESPRDAVPAADLDELD